MKFLLIRERLRRKNFKKIEILIVALKSIIYNQKINADYRWEASLLLSKLIKNNSKSTFKNRCFITGRRHGYIKNFNMSRIKVRNLARNNSLPSIYKLNR